jgi:hypothetical protein
VPAAQRGATTTTAAQPSSQLAPATTAAHTSDANASPSRPLFPTFAIVAALAAPLRPSALQEQLPDAKILYSSATGASEPRNLAYMSRLGLFGFKDPSEMIELLSK